MTLKAGFGASAPSMAQPLKSGGFISPDLRSIGVPIEACPNGAYADDATLMRAMEGRREI